MELKNLMKGRIALQAILLFVILAGAGWLSISPLNFWSPDSGLRYEVVKAFLDNSWRSPAIDYGARFLDPELAYVPYYYIYFLVEDEMFLRIPTLFPFVASLLVPMLGKLALVLPPVIGGMASGLAIYKLGEIGGVRRQKWLLWTSLLGTPLLFYSLEFWDHTFVAAFSLWATVFLVQGVISGRSGHVVAAGFLAGISLSERAEYLPYAAALGVGLLMFSRTRVRQAVLFSTGAALAALPLALLQLKWIGNPLGVTYATYLTQYGLPELYPFMAGIGGQTTKPFYYDLSRMLTNVRSGDPLTFVATILSLVGIILIVFALRVPRWRKREVLLVGALSAVAGTICWAIAVTYGSLTGLITTASLLPFSAAVVRRDNRAADYMVYRFVLVVAGVFMLMILALWPYGGTHWASRYMLPVYPLFVYCAFYAFEHYMEQYASLRRITSITFFTLLFLGILVQLGGVRLLFLAHATDSRVRAELETVSAELIITNHAFLPSQMSALDKTFVVIQDEDAFQTLIPRMWNHDVHAFVVVSIGANPLTVPQNVGSIIVREVEPQEYELMWEDP